jgi:nitrite reductase/ring-hydroxylating ferredoxin subunit
VSAQSLRAQIAELLGEDPEAQPAPRSPRRLPVVEAAQHCPRQGIVAAIEEDGAPVAVAVLASGKQVVFPDNCPHDGGLLSDGYVDGELIVCSRHGWEFDPSTGACAQRHGVSIPCRYLLAEGSGPVDS